MKKKSTIKYKLKKKFKALFYQIFFYIYGKVQIENKIIQNNFLSEKSIKFKND